MERAIRPEAISLALFALVVALTGLVVIAQALLRLLRASRTDQATLRALGLTRRQMWSVNLMQVAVMAVVGASIAVLLSVLLSPTMPLGAARVAEPNPGIDVDVAVLVLGFVGIVVLLLAAVAWPSWRIGLGTWNTGASEATASSSGRLAWLSRTAIPVTASLGIRETLDPGAARGTIPVRSALVGSILSIVMVVGTLTFGANLVHLVTTPQLYGQTWQASIDTQFQTIPTPLIHSALDHRPGVVAWSSGDMGTVDVMDSHVPAIGLSPGVGPLVGPTLVSGRLPSGPGEIALGASVLRSAGRRVGQDITVGVNGAQRRMHIVGQAVFPAFDQGSFTSTDLGLGAIVTAADLAPPGEPVSDSSVFVLVRFAPGPDQARQVGNFGRASASYCGGVQQSTCFVTSQPPFDVGNYARIEGVPEVLAVVLAALGVAVARAIDGCLGPAPPPRDRHPQDDRVRPQADSVACRVASRDVCRGLVAHRYPAGHRRRARCLGPLRGRAGHRILVNSAGVPHRAVHSGGAHHRPVGRSRPGMDRQPRAASPSPAVRMTGVRERGTAAPATRSSSENVHH